MFHPPFKVEGFLFVLIFIYMIKFKHLVIFTSMLIAGCAAFFSVYVSDYYFLVQLLLR